MFDFKLNFMLNDKSKQYTTNKHYFMNSQPKNVKEFTQKPLSQQPRREKLRKEMKVCEKINVLNC